MCRTGKGGTRWSPWPLSDLCRPLPQPPRRATKPTPLVICAVSSSASTHSQQLEGAETAAPRTTCLLPSPVRQSPWPASGQARLPGTALTMLAEGSRPRKSLCSTTNHRAGSLLIGRRALHHLTFEINSVTSEEDLVTDVTEESDHKTLKTNKRTNLKNRHHIRNSQQVCPDIFAGAGAGNTTGPSVLCTVWAGAFTHPLTCWRKSIHPGPKLNFVFCAIAQISPNYSSMESKVCSLKF